MDWLNVVWLTLPSSGEPVSLPAAWISTCTWLVVGTRAATSPAWSPTTWRPTSGTTCRLCRSLWLPMLAQCTMARSTYQVRREAVTQSQSISCHPLSWKTPFKFLQSIISLLSKIYKRYLMFIVQHMKKINTHMHFAYIKNIYNSYYQAG